jgi:hypothetical protein
VTLPANNSGIISGNVNQNISGVDPWPVTGSVTIAGASPDFALVFDNAATPILYLGIANPGTAQSAASWRICKIDTTTGVVITWAGGSTNFSSVWANRLSLSYS